MTLHWTYASLSLISLLIETDIRSEGGSGIAKDRTVAIPRRQARRQTSSTFPLRSKHLLQRSLRIMLQVHLHPPTSHPSAGHRSQPIFSPANTPFSLCSRPDLLGHSFCGPSTPTPQEGGITSKLSAAIFGWKDQRSLAYTSAGTLSHLSAPLRKTVRTTILSGPRTF